MLTLLPLVLGAYRVTPIVFSGMNAPSVELSHEQSLHLDRLLGTWTKPGPTSVTVGYRGFRVDDPQGPTRFVRGAREAELLLLGAVDGLAPNVRAYMQGEIVREKAGELDLPDEGESIPHGDCKHVVGPDTPPVYNPKTDDQGCFVQEQGENNCYNYGTDIVTDSFAQPGRGSGTKWTANTCDNINASAIRDGLAWYGTDLPSVAPAKGHYVALLIWPDTNFHWIRMDASKLWSHKPGGTPVRDTDNNGKKITDPRKSDFSPWTHFCGFLHVVPSQITINAASSMVV